MTWAFLAMKVGQRMILEQHRTGACAQFPRDCPVCVTRAGPLRGENSAMFYCGVVGGVPVSAEVPIMLPITSPETIISTRRFNFLPSEVLLSATG
jgi:hypothetical protein